MKELYEIGVDIADKARRGYNFSREYSVFSKIIWEDPTIPSKAYPYLKEAKIYPYNNIPYEVLYVGNYKVIDDGNLLFYVEYKDEKFEYKTNNINEGKEKCQEFFSSRCNDVGMYHCSNSGRKHSDIIHKISNNYAPDQKMTLYGEYINKPSGNSTFLVYSQWDLDSGKTSIPSWVKIVDYSKKDEELIKEL